LNTIGATTTGGAARLANGVDSYVVLTTLKNADGTPAVGQASRLSVQAPSGVQVGPFIDNGDGTYSLVVASNTPGIYNLNILLDGKQIGSVRVNFIAASIQIPTIPAGSQQSAAGFGFLPGELVTVTVHSSPIALGIFTADANGRVVVSFNVPSSFTGSHYVSFAGATSGTVNVSFNVTGTGSNSVIVGTGGSVVSGFTGWPAVVAILLGLIIMAAFMWSQRRHQVINI